MHTCIIVPKVTSPVNLARVCIRLARVAFTHREKIIQWLRLTWDLSDLFLILPSATGFFFNTNIYITHTHRALPMVVFKRHLKPQQG